MGTMTIFFVSLPLMLVSFSVLFYRPDVAILFLFFVSPFLLPSIACGIVLWSAMMENLSRPTSEYLRERRHAERSLWS